MANKLNHTRVFKFGGASLENADGFRNVADIISTSGAPPLIVVVSALGKTTNLLESILKAAWEKNEKLADFYQELYTGHRSLTIDLLDEEAFEAHVKPILDEMRTKMESIGDGEFDYAYDQFVSFGEILSSVILEQYMKKMGMSVVRIDAPRVIKTDSTWRDARIDWDETEHNLHEFIVPILEKEELVLTQGFIASNQDDERTTLGREGSDFSGAILAFLLQAESLTIWKDVPGILSADPKQFENVTAIDRLSFLEAIEMTYFGAKVIHPKTIKPLQNKNIPLWVRSFKDRNHPGTFIHSDIDGFYPPVVVLEDDQIFIQIATRDFSFVAEKHLAQIFLLLDKYRIKVNLMRNSAIHFSVCVTNPRDRLLPLLKELEGEFEVKLDQQIELVTIRHYDQTTIDRMKSGKMILLEEIIRDTFQMVVKDVPPLHRKDA